MEEEEEDERDCDQERYQLKTKDGEGQVLMNLSKLQEEFDQIGQQ